MNGSWRRLLLPPNRFRFHSPLLSKLPRLTGKDLLSLFEKKGWKLVRVNGSHHIFRSPDGQTAVVPLHGNDPVHVGIVQQLLKKKLKLTDEEIAEL